MKKKFMKAIAVTLAIGTMATGTACGGGEHNDTKVEGMINITVSSFESGVGTAWLDNAAERFEALYKDMEFSNGSKGINIIVDPMVKNGTGVLESIKNSSSHVYLTEEVYYNDFISSNVLADITDIVTEDLTAYGENRSIEDKMDETVSSYLSVNGKYYAVPFWEGYSGIIYDRDLFEVKGLFLKTDGQFCSPNSFQNGVYVGTGTLSNGPDGQAGTSDDGLPATYDEFFKLCDYMAKTCSITPLIWPGAYQDYVNEFALQLLADYEGHDNMYRNYSFEGTDDTLVDSIDESGNITFKEPTDISTDVSLLTKQAGRYYALDFVSRIMNNLSDYSVSNIMSAAMSHYDCVDYFLKGKYISSLSTIGMMINGSWWQNEGADTFEELENTVGEQASLQNRRLGMMPLPKATQEQVGEVRTVAAQKSAFAFINGNIKSEDELQAAKLFLQYLCTNKSLVEFQKDTGMSWALDYTIDDNELDDLTYYAKTLYEIHNNADIVYPYSRNDRYFTKTSVVMSNRTLWTTKLKNGTENTFITYAFYNNQGLTAKDYFEGLKNLI